ncbi:MAG: toll/interleukin-1 receptor domain-containing protein [Hyphomonadaceae bacterium]|nr:toll/interleukin-1 receptor domain-containing protein [Hyphomonadaceae bacterium]
MADVFLSYAREDSARALQVAQGLQNAGLDVFWDNEIPPGQTWADYIEQKLTQSKALIVLWSEHSTKSQWVREEARMGRDKGVLIPVMIDASQPPFGFGEVQAANLASWNGEADHPGWKRFVDAVAQFAKAEPRPAQQAMAAPPRAAASPPQPQPAPAPAAKSGGVPTWAWVAGGVVGALVVLGIIGSMLPNAQQQQVAQGNQVQPATSAAVQPPATGGEDPQAIILQQLQQAQVAAAQQGFQLVGQPFSGSLAQGQSWNVPATLQVGYEYRVLGVCDRDCADLDLVMFDSAGRQISQDTTNTNLPIVSVIPAYNDNFTIQVQMYNCSIAPCYYALALYGRPAR